MGTRTLKSLMNGAVVADSFAGKTMMQQHRMVYAALSDQMQTTIHALSLKTYTPEQWQQI